VAHKGMPRTAPRYQPNAFGIPCQGTAAGEPQRGNRSGELQGTDERVKRAGFPAAPARIGEVDGRPDLLVPSPGRSVTGLLLRIQQSTNKAELRFRALVCGNSATMVEVAMA
jgi:hypothetical protein